jgi:hypothetical protein
MNDSSKTIYFENKTTKRQLDIGQIKRHLRTHLNNPADGFLLVITSDKSDLQRLNELKNLHVHFLTWHQVCDFCEQHDGGGDTDTFLLAQFAEHVKSIDEAWSPNMTPEILRGHSEYLSAVAKEDLFKQECWRLLDELKDSVVECISGEVKNFVISDHWGRIGVECTLKRRPLEQWLFFGIYYDTSDHKIPFKIDNEPELAVFFDMAPGNRKLLSQRFASQPSLEAATDQLGKGGFEFNFPKAKWNKWRICYWRQPMSSFADLTPAALGKPLNRAVKCLERDEIRFDRILHLRNSLSTRLE